MKYYSFIQCWSDTQHCIEFMDNVYKMNNNQISLNRNVLEKATKIVIFIYKVLFVLYTSVMIGMVFMPIVAHIWTGETIYILPAQIPGIDEASTIGYQLTAVYHTVMILIALMGTFISDFSIVGFLMNAWSLSQLFRNGFSELNDLMMNDKHDVVHRKFLIRNLLQRHQDFRK